MPPVELARPLLSGRNPAERRPPAPGEEPGESLDPGDECPAVTSCELAGLAFRVLAVGADTAGIAAYQEVLGPSLAQVGQVGQAGHGSPFPDFDLTFALSVEEAVLAARRAVEDRLPFALALLDVSRSPEQPIQPVQWAVQAAIRLRQADPGLHLVLVTDQTLAEDRTGPDLRQAEPLSRLVAEVMAKVPPLDKILCLHKPFHPQLLLAMASSACARWLAERRNQGLQADLEAMVEDKTRELARANDLLHQDIREFERVKRLILQAKMEWESTFDSVQDPIIVLDRDNRVRRLNRPAASRLGLEPRDAVGLTCAQVFDRPDHPGENSLRIVTLADRRLHSEEFSIPRLGGDFLVTVSPFFAQDGELLGTILVAHDITRHKVLEAQLRQAQKMEAIGTLAGGIAHDFNNILGIIMGYAEMSLEGVAGNALLTRRLSKILGSSLKARDLVAQILTFSRQGDQELRPMRIGPLVKEIMRLMRSSLPTDIHIREFIEAGETETETGPDTVLAEPTQIQQIVMNLCTNAAQSMRQGGVLTVSLSALDVTPGMPRIPATLPPGRYVCLSVKDTGEGMKPEVMERIFDPFFTTKRPGEGTGMGLSVVHGIVQRHGGSIQVESEPGHGSTFHILFPTTDRAATSLAEPQPVIPLGSGRILFVDDERALAEIGAEMLSSLGYCVTTAHDSLEALSMFRRDPWAFDLLVTDQTMPNLSGSDLARRVLELRPELPVIVCTGYSETLTAEEAKAIGIREFLLKPILKRRLADSVSRALSGPEPA